MSTCKPTVLFIDDLHWADSASLSLLHYIARSVSSERILLLAIFRSEEVCVKVEGQLHPLFLYPKTNSSLLSNFFENWQNQDKLSFAFYKGGSSLTRATSPPNKSIAVPHTGHFYVVFWTLQQQTASVKTQFTSTK